ncbi:flocculation protein FLO11-like [Trichechus manatus latirostris]|uniref:Flocculation protein FLO11-like n=1 Tax=Trichechus manatus latirostris TaxID=127582 RepID=A0A2Y9RPU2_TRIMA|nr:flocculation protein FLO11-like [Trichechus manatus latirostris]
MDNPCACFQTTAENNESILPDPEPIGSYDMLLGPPEMFIEPSATAQMKTHILLVQKKPDKPISYLNHLSHWNPSTLKFFPQKPGSYKHHSNPSKKHKSLSPKRHPNPSCNPKPSGHEPHPVPLQPAYPEPPSFGTTLSKPAVTTTKLIASTSTNIATSVSGKSSARPLSAATATLSDAPITDEIPTSSSADTTLAPEKTPENTTFDALTPSASVLISTEYFASICIPVSSETKSGERTTTSMVTTIVKIPTTSATSDATSIPSSTTLASKPTPSSQSVGKISVSTIQVAGMTIAAVTSVSSTIIASTTLTITNTITIKTTLSHYFLSCHLHSNHY